MAEEKSFEQRAAEALHTEQEKPKKLPKFPGSNVRHGTYAGWRRHQALGTKPCVLCKVAKKADEEDMKKVPVSVRRSRVAARAQAATHQAMRARHEAEWDELYEKFRTEFWRELVEEEKASE
jgi:hypothetical protein